MKWYHIALTHILCAIASVLWWRVHVIQFGLISVRHFTPDQVALITAGAVVSSVVFVASLTWYKEGK